MTSSISSPPGWDAGPLQGYPPALNSPGPIYTPGWREAPSSVVPKNTSTQCHWPGLEPRPFDMEVVHEHTEHEAIRRQ